MKHAAWILLALLVTSHGAVGAASADVLGDVMKMQKNGMWELKVAGQQGKPVMFCVTDTTRMGGLKDLQSALSGLSCRTDKDSLAGDRYEVVLSCNSADPNVGTFSMVMKGTARADYQSGTTTVSGGGRMIQMMFPSGKAVGGESRWLRPCTAGEKPGLQDAK